MATFFDCGGSRLGLPCEPWRPRGSGLLARAFRDCSVPASYAEPYH